MFSGERSDANSLLLVGAREHASLRRIRPTIDIRELPSITFGDAN
jgi:hypothetical protein